MQRIGLASALLIVVFLAAYSQIRGDQFEQSSMSTVAGNVLILREPAESRQSTFGFAVPNRARPSQLVIWYPDSTGTNPFGFIPTEWTTRPQLLPLTWDVRTLWASDVAGEAKP